MSQVSIDPVGFRKKVGVDEKTLLLFYGGIVGHAQGLQLILQAADRSAGRQECSIRNTRFRT
jgi:hypothetical protein